MNRTLLTLLTASAMLGFASTAEAACTDPSIKAQVSKSLATTGETINYSYDFCWNSAGDRYTVQLLKVKDGVETAVTPLDSRPLDGKAGAANGSGSYVIPAEGRYLLRVLYYRVGATNFETKGEIVFRANPAPVVTPDPVPTPTPVPETPAEPVGVITPVETPAEPIAAPEPVPAKLSITKRAAKKLYRAGQTSVWTIKVKNVSKTTAENVVMCDKIPARTQYVSASRTVKFSKGKACFKLGNVRSGAEVKTTVRLLIDRNIKAKKVTNPAYATSDNAATVRAQDSVKIPKASAPKAKAPVTG